VDVQQTTYLPIFILKSPAYMCLKEEPIFIQAQCILPPGLANEFGQMRILPFISKWAWDQFMWQQLPGLLHLMLQGINRKKNLYFLEDFCKKQQ
jgi:hypothetical protein